MAEGAEPARLSVGALIEAMVPVTLLDALKRRAREEPTAAFLKCDNGWLTFADIDRRSDRVAAGLAALGIGYRDRVALLCNNRNEVFDVFFACVKLGAIFLPLNAYLKGELLGDLLVDSGAEIFIGDDSGLRAVRPIMARTRLRQLVALDSDAGDDVLAFAALPDGAVPAQTVSIADIAVIIYTSGTTGPSKGCMLSHGYFGTAAPIYRELDWLRPGDRIFTTLPLFHAAALNCVSLALHLPGGSMAIDVRFSASTFMQRAFEEGAALTWGMGAMAETILARHAPFAADQSVRITTWFGLNEASAARMEERFNTIAMTNGFGQTECQGIALSRPGERVPGTIGKPGPLLEVRIVDDNDNEVPRGQPGEIVARPRVPHTMFSGYWNRPDATLEAWRNLWHHTGDLGLMRESGDMEFVDRKKDSLRRRGENVSSFEVERVVSALPQVDRVAVYAVAAPLGEDDIAVALTLHDGQALTPEAFFDHCRDNLPYFAVPRYLAIEPALPLTEATGRVQKHVLRARGITPDMLDLEALGFRIEQADRR